MDDSENDSWDQNQSSDDDEEKEYEIVEKPVKKEEPKAPPPAPKEKPKQGPDIDDMFTGKASVLKDDSIKPKKDKHAAAVARANAGPAEPKGKKEKKINSLEDAKLNTPVSVEEFAKLILRRVEASKGIAKKRTRTVNTFLDRIGAQFFSVKDWEKSAELIKKIIADRRALELEEEKKKLREEEAEKLEQQKKEAEEKGEEFIDDEEFYADMM